MGAQAGRRRDGIEWVADTRYCGHWHAHGPGWRASVWPATGSGQQARIEADDGRVWMWPAYNPRATDKQTPACKAWVRRTVRAMGRE